MTDHKARFRGLGRAGLALSSLLAVLCFLVPVIATGEIFRYQDDQGDWHFTDDPPERFESSVVPGITTSKSRRQGDQTAEDLASSLQSTFNPTTPIAYATLAVVSIKSDSSEGSGFFCSEEGHILTNRHLVRPAPDENADDSEAGAEALAENLQKLESSVKEARQQMELMTQDLKSYEDLIKSSRDNKTRTWAKDAHIRLVEQYGAARGRASGMERNIRKIKSKLRDRRQALVTKRGFRTPKTRFDIVLKDGTELVAKLIETSENQDLALLKLDGYRTPFLRLDPTTQLSQGSRVFAIGNPLGMQAAVSSGVVTQIAPDHLYTDAQILPGSSGGPLIGESGEVIGINVARRVAAGTSKYAAGFGKAIPVSLAVREFPGAIGKAPAQDFRLLQPQTHDPFWGATFGSYPAEQARPQRKDNLGSGKAGIFGGNAAQSVGFAQAYDFASEPIRLIIPDQEGTPRLEEPAEEPTTRSLDFPPEGGGLPPGISLPR